MPHDGALAALTPAENDQLRISREVHDDPGEELR